MNEKTPSPAVRKILIWAIDKFYLEKKLTNAIG